MATDNQNEHHRSDNDKESSPLLENQEPLNEVAKPETCERKESLPPPCKLSAQPSLPPFVAPEKSEWTADGVPLGVVGEIVGRTPWVTGPSHCLGRQDGFFSSDLEVCLLGSVAPCVLYGSNMERLTSTPRAFTTHCFSYAALYLIGHSFFGWNCLAPWFSYNSRTALRRRFNLEGTFESLARSHGCCESVLEDDTQREQCESACDFALHVFCHPCALCQEGREIRRRLPHPAFNAQPVLSMIPPTEQTMARNMP
ncbi:hypothetical protein V2J09_010552 [Rumex salicifolius]